MSRSRRLPARLPDASVAPADAASRRQLAARILTAWERESPTASKNSLQAKRHDLEAFGEFLAVAGEGEQQRLAACEQLLFGSFLEAQQAVSAWMAWMAEKVLVKGRPRPRRAPATRARRLAHLRGLVRMAQEHGLPWGLHLKGPRVKKYRDAQGPEAWKVYAVINTLAKASREVPRAARDCAILQLLFVMGLRRQTVADLATSDIVDGSLWLRVKGLEDPIRKSLPASTSAALQVWIVHRGTEPGPLFTGLRAGQAGRGLSTSQIYRLCHGHQLGHPHGLRHSGATKLAKEGHNTFSIQKHLGHAGPGTAQHYVDDVEDVPGQAAKYLAADLEALYAGADDEDPGTDQGQ